MKEPPPVVRIVDDDASFLRALERLLTAAGYSVQSFSSGADLLARMENTPGCVIADLNMPGVDGLLLQETIIRGPNALPVIFLTGAGDIPSTVKAMREGAEDFLTKWAPKEHLLAAVERAIARDVRDRVRRDQLLALRNQFGALTARQLDVLRHVVDGRLNKQIAADMGITDRTVKLHRTAIMTKLRVRSVAQLTKLVQAAKWFEDPPDDLR
jgi:two-component system, LuxR family, response regulator FixJ